MPDIKLAPRWVRYEPDLPTNRVTKDSPRGHRPFYFELAADLSKTAYASIKAQLDAIDLMERPVRHDGESDEVFAMRRAAHDDAVAHATAETLGPYVKLGAEPITFGGGEPVKTLEEYLRVMQTYQNIVFFAEPAAALASVNSLSGERAFFSERLSGGLTSTR